MTAGLYEKFSSGTWVSHSSFLTLLSEKFNFEHTANVSFAYENQYKIKPRRLHSIAVSIVRTLNVELLRKL